ncbi:hypothetical protein [Pseudomonas fluorescens]|uniref:hypothetical protein n=1 Tax=Pseudomonas fluorescens TaxID=294 RepID=UPI001BEA1E64|nr:hypothetical protein [Pseudomonas fluorescens]MBT2372379.1 hypothetical protein [Pseudomonas fluorescens]
MNKKTRDYFAKLNAAKNPGSVRLAELPPGEVDFVPGFPGLIYREQALAENLELRIPRWEDYSTDPSNPDTVRVYIKPVDDSEYGSPFISFQFSFDATLPEAYATTNIARGRRPPGHWDIRYDVFIVRIPNLSESDPMRLIVDTDAPYSASPNNPPAPMPPAGLTPPIEAADFPAPPDDRLLFTFADYVAFGRAPGDTLRAYYNGSDTPYVVDWPVTDALNFPLPKGVVEAGPDGFITLRYELVDAAGNISRLSSSLQLDVALMPRPADVRQPLINRAFPGDNLFDRVDASLDSGMLVGIPAYTNFQRGNDGDYFDVTLSTSLGSRTVPNFPLGSNSFPVQVPIPFFTLEELYGATVGNLSLTVTYVIKRRTVTYPPAPATIIDLNLHVVGPTPTNPPDLVNTDLLPALIKGVDAGGTEGADNELLPEHANRPARVYITLWSEAPTPDAEDFTIRIYYEGDLAATIPITSGMAGQVVPSSISWTLISKHGNAPPLKQVYYTISATGSPNRQESVITPVDVLANVKALDQPQVRNLEMGGGAPGIINCNTIRPLNTDGNIRVFIPPSDLFERFMVVRVSWRGFSDNTGTVEVTAASGFTDSQPLTPTDIALGFEVDLGPFSTIMKLIQPDQGTRLMGSARINYTIQTIDGPLTSSDALHLSRAIKVGATPTYCDNTPVPPAP